MKSAEPATMDAFEAALTLGDVKGRSPWEDAWHRLLKNRAAVTSALLMGVMILAVIFGPMLSPWDLDYTDWEHTNSPPSLANGHWFGTDAVGRDILVRTLQGGRISLLVGVVATRGSLLIGGTYGAIAGYYGGVTDRIMMRIVDILYSIPFIFVVIFIITILGQRDIKMTLELVGIDRITIFFLVVGAIYWLTMARVVRGQVISLKHEPFIEAARALGVSQPSIIARHILPNLVSIVIVYLTLTIPRVMLFEAFLSFLGLGVEPPNVSWGLLANEGIKVINPVKIYWWLIVFPSVALGITLFSLNFLGDGLRDALDPKIETK